MRWTFAGKVMSLLFNMLFRFVITFLPRSKCLLISWCQSPSAMIFGVPKNKVCHCFRIYLPWSDGTSCHDLQFFNVEGFFFPLFFISLRLISLQYCSGFCHTFTWISHGFTCVSHPESPSHLPPCPIPLGHPSAPAPSTCFMHQTWTGNLFHNW